LTNGGRAIFYIGLALYGVSFFLIAVATLAAYGGAYATPMSGYDCARFALGLPWGDMIPFCWVVFYYHHFYPREGHTRFTRGHATNGER
jgi:hypothetical protein